MSRSQLWEQLSPLSARMPKVVRENEILRIAAVIPGEDVAAAAYAARREVLAWAQRRSGGRLPERAWELREFEYLSGGRNSVASRIVNGESDIWAIRADDSDKDIAGRTWTTEVIVGLMGDQLPRFSARLLVSTTEDEIDISPHTPGFVQQIAETCGLRVGPFVLSAQPWVVDSVEEADLLVDHLLHPKSKDPNICPNCSRIFRRPAIERDGTSSCNFGDWTRCCPASSFYLDINRATRKGPLGIWRSSEGIPLRLYLRCESLRPQASSRRAVGYSGRRSSMRQMAEMAGGI